MQVSVTIILFPNYLNCSQSSSHMTTLPQNEMYSKIANGYTYTELIAVRYLKYSQLEGSMSCKSVYVSIYQYM